MRTQGLWEDYPHFQLSWYMKLYYLVQLAFWVHQIITLNIEKRRKDYWQVCAHSSIQCTERLIDSRDPQMFAHHIITVSLMILSYRYNFTRIGNVILALMDPCDIIFSTAKMLKYTGYATACDATFGLFLISWLVSRQILYPKVVYATIYESEKYITLRNKGTRIRKA